MSMLGAQQSFTTGTVNKTPVGPGVYQCLSGSNTIYIGWTGPEGIRKKLLEHYSGKLGTCTQISTSFLCEEHDDPEARAKELLQEYKDTHGSLPRCNR